jgi:hypothetical protein
VTDQPDMLDALRSPEDLAGMLPGTIRGDTEGVAAGLFVWCGDPHGWRPLGELLNRGTTTLIRHRGRFIASLTFDVGPVTAGYIGAEAPPA